MNQRPSLTDEEALPRGHFEVKHRHNRFLGHRLHFGNALERANLVARLQVASHHPTVARFPEPGDAGRGDGFGAEIHLECHRRRVMKNAIYGLVAQHPGVGRQG